MKRNIRRPDNSDEDSETHKKAKQEKYGKRKMTESESKEFADGRMKSINESSSCKTETPSPEKNNVKGARAGNKDDQTVLENKTETDSEKNSDEKDREMDNEDNKRDGGERNDSPSGEVVKDERYGKGESGSSGGEATVEDIVWEKGGISSEEHSDSTYNEEESRLLAEIAELISDSSNENSCGSSDLETNSKRQGKMTNVDDADKCYSQSAAEEESGTSSDEDSTENTIGRKRDTEMSEEYSCSSEDDEKSYDVEANDEELSKEESDSNSDDSDEANSDRMSDEYTNSTSRGEGKNPTSTSEEESNVVSEMKNDTCTDDVFRSSEENDEESDSSEVESHYEEREKEDCSNDCEANGGGDIKNCLSSEEDAYKSCEEEKSDISSVEEDSDDEGTSRTSIDGEYSSSSALDEESGSSSALDEESGSSSDIETTDESLGEEDDDCGSDGETDDSDGLVENRRDSDEETNIKSLDGEWTVTDDENSDDSAGEEWINSRSQMKVYDQSFNTWESDGNSDEGISFIVEALIALFSSSRSEVVSYRSIGEENSYDFEEDKSDCDSEVETDEDQGKEDSDISNHEKTDESCCSENSNGSDNEGNKSSDDDELDIQIYSSMCLLSHRSFSVSLPGHRVLSAHYLNFRQLTPKDDFAEKSTSGRHKRAAVDSGVKSRALSAKENGREEKPTKGVGNRIKSKIVAPKKVAEDDDDRNQKSSDEKENGRKEKPMKRVGNRIKSKIVVPKKVSEDDDDDSQKSSDENSVKEPPRKRVGNRTKSKFFVSKKNAEDDDNQKSSDEKENGKKDSRDNGGKKWNKQHNKGNDESDSEEVLYKINDWEDTDEDPEEGDGSDGEDEDEGGEDEEDEEDEDYIDGEDDGEDDEDDGEVDEDSDEDEDEDYDEADEDEDDNEGESEEESSEEESDKKTAQKNTRATRVTRKK